MWLRPILTALFSPDNVAARDPILDQIEDRRLARIAGRIALVGGVLLSGASLVAGLPVPLVFPLLMLAGGALLELVTASTRRAVSVRVFDRAMVGWCLVLLGWATAGAWALGGVVGWPGIIAYSLVVATAGSLLDRRGAVTIVVAAGAAYLALSGAALAEIAPESISAIEESSRALIGVYSLLAVLLLPLTGVTAQAAARHRRDTRTRMRRTELQLSRVQQEARADTDRYARQLTEMTAQRADLEERNRYLSVINAVSFALSEPVHDAAAVERALRLVARLFDLSLVQVYVAPEAGHPAEEWLVAATSRQARQPALPQTVLREIIDRGQPLFVAEREPAPMLLPDDDAYAIVPLALRDVVFGAVALKGQRPGGWSEADRHLVLLLGRELAGALENARLYRDAVRVATREALIATVARQVHGLPATAEAWEAVLAQLQDVFGDALLALVLTPPGSRAFQLAAVRGPGGDRGDCPMGGGAAEDPGAPALPDGWLEDLLALPTLVDQREQPLLVDGYGEVDLPHSLRRGGIRQLVVAPVRRAHLLCGALVVATSSPAAWGQHEHEVLARIGDVVGQRVESDALTQLQSRRIDELSVLAEIAAIVQSTDDTDRLIAGFSRAFKRLIPASHLYIARLNDEGELEQVHTMEQERQGASPEPGSFDARHRWFSLRSPSPWFRSDDAPPSFVSLEAARGIVVPLRPKGMMLGLAVVVTEEEPSEELCALAEQACGQLALALDGASLYRKATERAARIQVLGNLARIVASAASLREAFDAFAEEVRWLIPFDRAAMLLVSSDQLIVTPYATYPDRDIAGGVPLPVNGSPIATVTRAAGPITMSRRDPRYGELDWTVFSASAATVAAVPVLRGSACVAVFALVRDAGGTHDERYRLDDLAALEEVARLLAVSIERADLFEQAEHSARHDLLTGLPNYRYLQERLATVRMGMNGAPGSTALLMVDMDDMKMINDSLGHHVGDRTIRLVGDELRAACREGDFIARVGGDEFMVLMEGGDIEAAERAAEAAHAALTGIDLGIPGAPSRLRLSIGVAAAPLDGGNARELAEAADRAMYDAKFAGGGRTALARNRGAGASRYSRGRADRLIDAIVRSATVGSVDAEREALALAQRYVIAAALHAGAGATDAPALRLLVAAEAARRLRQVRDHPDRATAIRLLDSLEAHWRPETGGATAAAALIRLAVDLAWLQAAPPAGEGLGLDAGLARLKVSTPDEDGTRLKLAALERAARSAAVERRQSAA